MLITTNLPFGEGDDSSSQSSLGASAVTQGGSDDSRDVSSDDEVEGVVFFLHTFFVGGLFSGVVGSSSFLPSPSFTSLTTSSSVFGDFFFGERRLRDLFFLGCS